MFIRNTILTALLIIPAVSYAGVTVYDDTKGGDVKAKLEDGKLEQLKIQQAPKVIYREDPTIEQPKQAEKTKDKSGLIAPTRSPSDIQLVPWEIENYDLGHARIFVDGRFFTQELSKTISKIKLIDGLEMSYYLRPPDQMKDLVIFFDSGFLRMSPDIEFSTDSSNRHFKELGLKEHMTVHYTSPFGDKRAFSLKEPQYFFAKIDYVRRQVRGEE